MASHEQMPKYHELMNPLLESLRELGGSGSIEELSAKVSEKLDLPDEVLSIPHDPNRSSQTEVEYRLAWARTYLKKFGLLDNSSRGVWVLLPDKADVTEVNPQEVVKTVREMDKQEKSSPSETLTSDDDLPEEAEPWRAKLHRTLTQGLSRGDKTTH